MTVQELTDLHKLYQELTNAYDKCNTFGEPQMWWHKNELFGASFVIARLIGVIDDKKWNGWINQGVK